MKTHQSKAENDCAKLAELTIAISPCVGQKKNILRLHIKYKEAISTNN